MHKLWFQLMKFLLREKPSGVRPYRHSFLSAAEVPLEALCLISIVCHAAVFLTMPMLSAQVVKTIAYYSAEILNLSTKAALGAILYGVVNKKIARSSRGIARKSDILGAETSRQESQVLAVGQTARVLVILCTALSCLPVFKVDLGTVLSFCGIGGLAISLLSKGVFVNLIGSLTIYLTQPFTLGDWILTVDGEVDGWVQSMGPYHTVVMRWDRRPLYIPNARFMQVQIINGSRMTNRRILADIPLRFGDLDKVNNILEEIRTLIENHKEVDHEQHRLARLRQIAPHAALIWVSCYTRSINLKDFVAVREDIILSIKNIMFKNGATFATTLEREHRRVDSMGIVEVSSPPPPLPAGEEEVSRKYPQSQKQLLATELQRLKLTQESIFAREKELRESEANLLQEKQKLQGMEGELMEQHGNIERQMMALDQRLGQVTDQEEKLMAEEEEIDSFTEELQAKEERLEQVLREKRIKSGPEFNEGVQKREPNLIDFVDDRNFTKLSKELSQSRRDIEQQREMLKEQKAEFQEQQEEQEEPLAGEGGSEAGKEEGEDMVEEESKLDEAARFKKIAESLGGE